MDIVFVLDTDIDEVTICLTLVTGVIGLIHIKIRRMIYKRVNRTLTSI